MTNGTNWRTRLLEQQPWVTFLVPFLVFMLVGTLEPTTPKDPGGKLIGLSISYADYPWLYTTKIALTLAAIIFVWPGYREFRWRLTPLAVLVGIVGGPLWIGLCLPDVEHTYLVPALNHVGLGGLIGAGTRSAFNPFEHLTGASAWAFLAVRFFGLVAVVPLIEEFSCAGF